MTEECIPEKIVKIRHATEVDTFLIEEMLKKHHLDTSELDYNQFVIATENGDTVGIGRLKKIGKVQEIGCITIIEQRVGIGKIIAKHLLHATPVKLLYVGEDKKDYFKELGFKEMKEGAKELYEEIDKHCKGALTNALIMVYERD
jgi:N-acetylglutamate synthase-like GNAT family acetyltransferase